MILLVWTNQWCQDRKNTLGTSHQINYNNYIEIRTVVLIPAHIIADGLQPYWNPTKKNTELERAIVQLLEFSSCLENIFLKKFNKKKPGITRLF